MAFEGPARHLALDVRRDELPRLSVFHGRQPRRISITRNATYCSGKCDLERRALVRHLAPPAVSDEQGQDEAT